MAIHEPEQNEDDLPVPEKKERRLPLGWITLAGGLLALVALLALAY